MPPPTPAAARASEERLLLPPMRGTKDTLLGKEGFWALTFVLEPDYDGPVSATLVRRPLHRERECAVLYLHGYVDYFFQAHLADYYQYTLADGQSGKGCDFFALDLRKYGRSLPLHYKYPNFAKNLDEYYPEITKALTIIRGEGYPFVILNGHSTGALTAARYLQDGKERGVVDAAFLNSPFLDFNDRDLSGFGERIARIFGKIAPHSRQKSPVPRVVRPQPATAMRCVQGLSRPMESSTPISNRSTGFLCSSAGCARSPSPRTRCARAASVSRS